MSGVASRHVFGKSDIRRRARIVLHAPLCSQRGLIHEQKKEFAEARNFFKNATSLSPFHVPSLQHLVSTKFEVRLLNPAEHVSV